MIRGATGARGEILNTKEVGQLQCQRHEFGLPDGWRADHLFGLRMPEGLKLEALKEELESRRIFVSLRGNALRVSPRVYNDESDVGALIEALQDVVTPTTSAGSKGL